MKGQEEEISLLLCIGSEESENTMVLLNEDKVFPHKHEEHNGDNQNVWYMDNGASNHMTGVKEMFAELDESITGKVRFGDGSKIGIHGKGTLLFECKNGDQMMIPGVYFIPALKSNILSLGQLTEEGFDIHMRHEFLRIYDKQGRLIMKIERSPNRLYKHTLIAAKPVCLMASKTGSPITYSFFAQ